MADIKVHYGKQGLIIHSPPECKVDIISAKVNPPLPDLSAAIATALDKPLGALPLKELVSTKRPKTTVVVVSDATRPVPTRLFLPQILERIGAGCPSTHIIILVATGLHRPSTPTELKAMLGDQILASHEVINHDANDGDNQIYLGTTTRGTFAHLDRRYVEADFRITTGYVEPHFFAGLTGGRKSLVPGIAGAETIKANHSPAFISHPFARFGNTCGNPIYEDAVEIAQMKPPDFCMNVTIDAQHQITGIAAGEMQAVSDRLVQEQLATSFFPLKKPYDVVVCNNGGYPLDLNLYQAVKSMAIGELAVKPGGIIIACNECSDGIGHESFEKMIKSNAEPAALLKAIEKGEVQRPDLWQVQVLARVLTKATIYVVSSLKQADLGIIGIKYAATVEDALTNISASRGTLGRVLILPDGPLAIPLPKNKEK